MGDSEPRPRDLFFGPLWLAQSAAHSQCQRIAHFAGQARTLPIERAVRMAVGTSLRHFCGNASTWTTESTKHVLILHVQYMYSIINSSSALQDNDRL